MNGEVRLSGKREPMATRHADSGRERLCSLFADIIYSTIRQSNRAFTWSRENYLSRSSAERWRLLKVAWVTFIADTRTQVFEYSCLDLHLHGLNAVASLVIGRRISKFWNFKVSEVGNSKVYESGNLEFAKYLHSYSWQFCAESQIWKADSTTIERSMDWKLETLEFV